MPDIIDEKVKISELNPIPNSWGSQVIKTFLTQKGLLAVADSEGLAGQLPDTYKVTMQELVDALGLSDISEAITIALGLKQGCYSLVFVDTDKSSVTQLDDGKTLKYAFSSINQALSTSSEIIIVVGSSVRTETITNTINARLILNLNSKCAINIQNGVQLNANLTITSKGSVVIGTLNYQSGVSLVNIEAFDATISTCSVRTIIKADNNLTFTAISADSKLVAKNIIISSISNANVNIESENLTFNNNNSIQGNVRISVNSLNTYTMNVIGGSLQLDIGTITLSDSGNVWLIVDSLNGADISAFIKVKPSFYDETTNYLGYITNHDNEKVNITYAGVFPTVNVVGGNHIIVDTQQVGDETTHTINVDGTQIKIFNDTDSYNSIASFIRSGGYPLVKHNSVYYKYDNGYPTGGPLWFSTIQNATAYGYYGGIANSSNGGESISWTWTQWDVLYEVLGIRSEPLREQETTYVYNNKIQSVTLTRSSVTFKVSCYEGGSSYYKNGTVPFFCIEITAQVNTAIKVSMENNSGITTLYTELGDTLYTEAGNKYQLKCFGMMWTLEKVIDSTLTPEQQAETKRQDINAVGDVLNDDISYVRKNGEWTPAENAIEDSLTIIELP